MRIVAWILCIFLVLVPAALLVKYPQSYDDPLVVFLLSVAIAVVSVIASRIESIHDAKKRTQTEWLSQAESSCDRLLTTMSQVKRLKERTLHTCDDATLNMPELQKDNLRPLKTLLERNCESTGCQLHDIETHMESALADWQRFIRKNCEGAECDQIGRALDRRRAELLRPIVSESKKKCHGSSEEKREEKVPEVDIG